MLLSLCTALQAADGLIKKTSAHTVENTVQRLKNLLEKKGIKVFAHIDHQENAAGAGLELDKLQLVIFGNPRLGTPLMQSNPTAGIDLPMKALVWEGSEGKVWLAYNDPFYLARRHGIEDRGAVLEKMSAALNKISTATTAP
jgi:uncharacterized protein (DUF302 family)